MYHVQPASPWTKARVCMNDSHTSFERKLILSSLPMETDVEPLLSLSRVVRLTRRA